MGRKVKIPGDPVRKERAGMACTEKELEVLTKAAYLDGRTSVGDFIRSVVMPVAKQKVANETFYAFSLDFDKVAAGFKDLTPDQIIKQVMMEMLKLEENK